MRVRAFRIVPNETEGNMMIDGEKVPYGNDRSSFISITIYIYSYFSLGSVQGEILPSIARCMGKQPEVD